MTRTRPDSPLRILMVLNAPWDRRLGGPRVQIELAEQFAAMGCAVDRFAWEDAFPKPPAMPRLAGFTRSFSRVAVAWIRERAGAYDVIDARAGSLTASKARLGFSGLLVTRSTGLLPIYEREFLAADRAGGGARLATRLPRRLQRGMAERRHRLGIENCDLLNVLNSDEEAYARNELGIGEKTVKLLHGLSRERAAAFAATRRSLPERRPVVAFVGSWSRRKGSADARRILAAVSARVPGAGFRFLGTGAPAERVIADCGGNPAGIEVMPSFEPDQLPGLLGDASVGILPSYVEGFPFGILEMLAAGVPVVAYDAPGARETLPHLDRTLLVPRGDGRALGERVADLLADPGEVARLSTRGVALADSLSWEEIAAETLEIYTDRLARLRGASEAVQPALMG